MLSETNIFEELLHGIATAILYLMAHSERHDWKNSVQTKHDI